MGSHSLQHHAVESVHGGCLSPGLSPTELQRADSAIEELRP